MQHPAHRPVTTGPNRPLVWWWLVLLAVALPWLNPATWGPNPEMVQRLLSLACAAALLAGWALWGATQPLRTLVHGLAWAWLVAALCSAWAGLLQYFGVAGPLAPWISPTDAGVAYANLRQRNQFASLLSLGLAALLYLLQTQPPRLRWQQAAAALAVLLLALGNAASSSRTGVLQWVALFLLALLWHRRSAPRLLGWAGLALLAYLLAALLLPLALAWRTGTSGNNALERFQEDSGCGERSVLWHNVLELIAQHPWAGWGWGELKFAHFITPYRGERFCALLDNAHNLPLHLAVELGLPAALLLCGGALWLLLRVRAWRETEPARQLAWAVLLVIALHSLVEYPLWYGPFQMAALLGLALLWRTGRPLHPGSVLRGLGLGMALGLLATTVYAGWDYWRVGQLYLPQAERAATYREDTLAKVQDSWLFRETVRFARVTTATPSPENAARLYADALQSLHYSPEPKVIGALLESARLLGREDAGTAHIRAQWRAIYGEALDIAP
ncbi:O-antigen ligase family protein [uncultured Rhodoferax sp.]|uniref:PglL family O-oligosaccharyltransferase n=1 Tax=uncultured Rhodoferax sp. TaxID=223188 RepID=UPI0025DAA984|nr:O-antigen ligase family protein [uncultured Rhodoferax sp.]